MGIKSMVKKLMLSTEYATHPHENNSKIIFYHDVNNDKKHPAYTDMSTSIDMFLNHINVIREKGFEIVPQIKAPTGQILIVFDDGWKGIYEQRDALLEKQVLPVICIAPGLLNHPGYLSDSQVKELHALGFGFASHSWLHQSLTLFNGNEDSLRREILDSKSYIEDLLSSKVSAFCYPNGHFSQTIYEATLKYGYEEAWSVVDGNYYDEVMPKVKRRCLVQFASPQELKMIISGANRIMANKHLKSTFR